MLIDHYHDHSLALPDLRRFLQQARRAAGLRGKYSVCLTTDEEVRALNAQFRGMDKPTDVLSFPAEDGEEDFPSPEPGAAPGAYLGDIVISLDTAARQAAALGHDLDQEVRILIVHGLLHLAGYDHETDHGEMRELEGQLRTRLGLVQGLIARAEASDAPTSPAAASMGKKPRSRPPARISR